MSQIKQAIYEFGKIRRILNAFEGVETILAMLENAEQVGRELDLANAKKRAEMLALIEERQGFEKEKRKDYEVLKASQSAVEQNAKQIIQEARAEGQILLDEARKQKSVLDEERVEVNRSLEEAKKVLHQVKQESESVLVEAAAAKSYLAKLQATS